MTEREPEPAASSEQPSPSPSEESAATPQLTAAQSKRVSQPMVAMIITMAVTMGAVAVVFLMNPEPDVEPYQRDEDVVEEAGYVADVAEFDPLAPDVPSGWTANYARWETRAEQGVPLWEVGYTTDAMDFIGFAQTDQGNPTWIAAETRQAVPSGTVAVESLEFEVRDGDGDRVYYVLTEDENHIDSTTLVISGDAGQEEFTLALRAIVESLGQDPLAEDADQSEADEQ